MIVNRKKLASVFGVALPTIDAWRERGMPAVTEGGLGREWEFDTRACIDWWADNNNAGPAADPREGEPGFETIEEAERRKMVAQADRAEVYVAKEAGILVPIDEVAAVVAEEHGRVRARLLSLPNELRPKVMTFLANDREAAEQLLTETEETILEALAEIRSWAPAPEAVEASDVEA
jgi:terminase small subunit / prophage DNA-packing protein